MLPSERIDELEAELRGADENLDELEAELRGADESNAALQRDNDRLQAHVKELETKIASMRIPKVGERVRTVGGLTRGAVEGFYVTIRDDDGEVYTYSPWSIISETEPPPERTAEDERADVVAWLRTAWRDSNFVSCIERGEHVGAAARAKGGG